MMIPSRLIFLVALTAVAGGCAKELTAGGQREGEVEVAATDRDEQAAPLRSPSHAPGTESASRTEGSRQILPSVAGTVTLRMGVSLVDESGVVWPVGGVATTSIPVGSSTLVAVAVDRLPEGFYPTARVRFEEVSAEVSGLDLPGGAFSGTVSVALPTGPLLIDGSVGVEVTEEVARGLVVVVNSLDWLLTAQLNVGLVPPRATVATAAFENAVEVGVR